MKKKYNSKERVCSSCGKKLSIWNPQEVCFCCSGTHYFFGTSEEPRVQLLGDVRTRPYIYK